MKKEYKKILYTAMIVLSFLMIETICLLIMKSNALQKELIVLEDEYNNQQDVTTESDSEYIIASETEYLKEVPLEDLERLEELEYFDDTEGLEELESSVEVFGSVETLEAGRVLDAAMINLDNLEPYFQISEITDDIYNRINGKSYKENEVISVEELQYIKVLHYNFDHEIQVGELIVHFRLSKDVVNIFKELFEGEYEIDSMYLVDNYWNGDAGSTDMASLEQNNSSAFNYREITGGGILSMHAYGCAIDINPQQNPYINYYNGESTWLPENSTAYIDRTSDEEHMIDHDDLCYQTFIKYGFEWGGDWDDVIDYQHFQKEL